ncbi:MAG: hypothetical protein IKS64_04365, partial [Muribaculaceae bacterium]|nr:hypothetical protein [Muribaculaceae bacterium]
MKKLILLAMLLCNIIVANAQYNETMRYNTQRNDTVLYIENIEGGSVFAICANKYDRVLIYAQQGCTGFHWEGSPFDWSEENPLTLNHENASVFSVTYFGCDMIKGFSGYFITTLVPTSSTRTIWKRQGYTETLEAVGADSLGWFSYHWNTGEDTGIIDIVNPGIYTCEISDICGTSTRTFIVKDNVELYRATVDLATNLNKVTWQTTPVQAEYISQVKVERDGMVVGTAPYMDGQFIDNIGSENAARNYRLTGIDMDGNECPIPSYQKGTLHVDYSPNASNPNKLNMAWTPPFIEEGAPISVSYFQICKYDPTTGEVTVIDQIGANNTIGSYDVNLFDGGYATVAALFSEGKDYEDV